MITQLVQRFDEARPGLRERCLQTHPDDYGMLVRWLVEAIQGEYWGEYDLDPERITAIDHGHYQGTLVFVIGCQGYQPNTYYCTVVNYGSCSGCDTLEQIKMDGDWGATPSIQQANDYLTLMLHLVQQLKVIT